MSKAMSQIVCFICALSFYKGTLCRIVSVIALRLMDNVVTATSLINRRGAPMRDCVFWKDQQVPTDQEWKQDNQRPQPPRDPKEG